MAHVRVYCGLASAHPPQQLAVGSSSLCATVVDDAGRLLDLCDLGDDPYGYAYLSTLLAERASGPYSVAIAADSDQRLVPALLTTAGWALAFVDNEFADDVAERFADELSDEIESAPIQRRALGLARALQAGTVSATSGAAPPTFLGLKPVLAAHGALAAGRHAAAMSLREVLRELYPAALRAYPDPADPVALAVMSSLPEPGALTAMSGRGRDSAAAADAVASRLVAAGIADQAAIAEAITALRVAIAETPRRSGAHKGLTPVIAETVRQSVAAVQACDAACAVLVRALVEQVAAARSAPPAPEPAEPFAAPARASVSIPDHQVAAPHRSAAAPPISPGAHRPMSPGTPPPSSPGPPLQPPGPAPAPFQPPHAPVPVAAAPVPAPRPMRTAAPQPVPRPVMGAPPAPAGPPPMAPPPATPAPMAPPPVAPPPVAPPPAAPAPEAPMPATARMPEPAQPVAYAPLAERPVSVPPPPPPGITPIGTPRSPIPAQRAPEGTAPRAGLPQGPPPGSRADWPARTPQPATRPEPASAGPTSPATLASRTEIPAAPSRSPGGSVKPPWQDEDLKPPEPPVLRLVEPTLPEDRARGHNDLNGFDSRDLGSPDLGNRDLGSPDLGNRDLGSPDLGSPDLDSRDLGSRDFDSRDFGSRDFGGRHDVGGRNDFGSHSYDESPLGSAEPPPLRLVEPPGNGAALIGIPRSVPPVSADDDDTLLIFAQTRSAWFTGENDESTWGAAQDAGWRAAEQASRQPTVGDRTEAGLPRRVPRANLVPGSPVANADRPLRVVRDPATIAANTSGYFNGWRRGQESNGYALGGRQQAVGAWDFARDDERLAG